MNMRHQRGMSFFSAIVMVLLLGFVGIFVVKLIPTYLEYFNIRTVISSFKTEQVSYPNAASVQEAIRKRFDINNVKSISASDVTVVPAGGGYYDLHVEYEARVPFVSNITMVVNFSEDGQARGGSESP